jgi:hypothetical protein
MTGYSDSKTPPKPPIESVAGYKTGKAPAAAKFGVGGDGGAAAEARRQHSRDLTNRSTDPRTTPSRDNG